MLAEDLPRRWSHVQGVASQARGVCKSGRGVGALLVPAAVLHDIGYAEEVAELKFHPIDGARHLRRLGVDERIVNLVAHHTCAHIEAELRGLLSILEDEFPRDDSLPHDELCFCDLTTSPDGELVTVDERLAEIRHRYGPDSLVHQFIDLAEPEMQKIVQRVAGPDDQPR